jgi:hypothetical protein
MGNEAERDFVRIVPVSSTGVYERTPLALVMDRVELGRCGLRSVDRSYTDGKPF